MTWVLKGAAGIAMVTLSTAYGLSRSLRLESARIMLTAFSLPNVLSRLATGYISDVAGRNSPMTLTFFGAGVSYLLMFYAGGLVAMALLSAVISFAFGTLFAVSAPLAVDCLRMRHFESTFVLIFSGYGFIARMLGPSLSGYLLDSTTGNFSLGFYYLGVFYLSTGTLIRFVVPAGRSSSPQTG